jgi:hypothetical protein
MPDFLRKFIGLLLIFAAVGVASCQALVASCSFRRPTPCPRPSARHADFRTVAMSRLLLLAGVILIPLTALILLLKRRIRIMAERYQQAPGRFPSPKGMLMFLLPLPVLIAAVVSLAHGSLDGLLGNAAGYGLFLAGALLLRRGLLTEAEYGRRRVAKAPWPLKTLGGSVIALATGVTAWFGAGQHPAIAVAFGLAALLGCYLSYGFDPRVAKRFTDRDGVDVTDRVLEALTQAEAPSPPSNSPPAISATPNSTAGCGALSRRPGKS